MNDRLNRLVRDWPERHPPFRDDFATDAKAVGLRVNVFMSVSLATQVEKALQAFERAAAARPEVMECYLMTGDSDYLLRIVVPDLEAYERFVMDFTKIPGIAQIRSSFALRPVKQVDAVVRVFARIRERVAAMRRRTITGTSNGP